MGLDWCLLKLQILVLQLAVLVLLWLILHITRGANLERLPRTIKGSWNSYLLLQVRLPILSKLIWNKKPLIDLLSEQPHSLEEDLLVVVLLVSISQHSLLEVGVVKVDLVSCR